MIKIQIKDIEDLVIFVDTVEEAAEFISRFQSKEEAQSDLRGMSAPDAAVTLLRTSGEELTSSQIAYKLIALWGLSMSHYRLKTLTQNIGCGLRRRLKHINPKVEKNGKLWKFKTGETNDIQHSIS